MKTPNNSSVRPRAARCFAGLALAMTPLFSGCATDGHVIASTATVIGVQIGQGAADTTPQAKLGYNRAEFAFVPTNRAVNATNQTAAGAEQSADVVMELRYGNIFSMNNGGIYQRLAVGKTAVSQAGAALMFARDSDGKIDAEQGKAVKSALEAIHTSPADVRKAMAPLDNAYVSLFKDDQKKKIFDDAAKTAGFDSYQDFSAKHTTLDQVQKVRTELEKNADVKTALDKYSAK